MKIELARDGNTVWIGGKEGLSGSRAKTHQEARRGSVERKKKQTKVSHMSEAPSKLNCAVAKHISKLLRVHSVPWTGFRS